MSLGGLEGEYLLVRAGVAELATEVTGLRAGGWDGLNVTMPLKVAAARAADRLTRDAELSGSVNTLARRDGEVVGASTDAGTMAALIAEPRFTRIGTILVLGAGGAAAAMMVGAGPDREVYVSSRRLGEARSLADRHGGEAVPWGTVVPGALLVNATPIGMRGEELPSPVVDAAAAVVDLPYADGVTPLVARAGMLGLEWVGGHEFLVRQAIASFVWWTGIDLDFEDVSAALRKA